MPKPNKKMGKSSKAPKKPRTSRRSGKPSNRKQIALFVQRPRKALTFPGSNIKNGFTVNIENYVGPLTVTANATLFNASWAIKPTNFPYVSSMATLYEKVRLVSLQFILEPMFGTSVPGAIVGVIDYDGRDYATAHDYSVVCGTNCGMGKMAPVKKNMWMPLTVDYVPQDSQDKNTNWDIVNDKFRPDNNYLLRLSLIGFPVTSSNVTYYNILVKARLCFTSLKMPAYAVSALNTTCSTDPINESSTFSQAMGSALSSSLSPSQ